MPGLYKLAGNATDSNTLGPLVLHATASGADPTDVVFQVVAFNPQDAVRLGLTAFPNVATGNAGAVITSGTGTAQLSTTSGVALANATQIGGQTASASGTITFPAATLASTNNLTGGTVAVATTCTNLTNAPTAGDFTASMKTSLNAATPAVTVSDKTGFLLASSQAFNNSGTQATVTNLVNAPTAGDLTAAMKTSVQTAATLATPACASVTGAVGTVDAAVAAIKAKTDQFRFTVTNEVDANTKYMNDTPVIGHGATGDGWRGH